jgi:hypothetical protein
MKVKLILIFIALSSSAAFAQNYRVDWYVIGSGGGHSQSASYSVDGTIGQPLLGRSISASYIVDAGFWMGAVGPRCEYIIGDDNGNGIFNGLDVTYGVSYFKGGPPPPYQCECTSGLTWYVAGDVNATCSFNGVDITYMVAYLKGSPNYLTPCPECPPN